MRTCGEVLVELLEAYGIDTVFGIPGVHTVELYRGLPNTRIRHVTPRHEQGAGFMADGYARASGRPAACFIITGPGMTNIATAMGQALADSVPMLVISSVNNTRELGLGEGRLHELPNQRALVSGVSVFSHTLLSPAELPAVLARAFAVFDAARPGPVHIEIPLDIITAPADDLPRAAHRVAPPGPDPRAIARAAELLLDARAPFVILGGGAARAPDAARALAERLAAPVTLTVNAKGILPAGHPLSLGSTLPQPPVLAALRSADVVLAIGTELGETDTLLFDGAPNLTGQVIRIDIDPAQLTRNAPPAIGICADAGLAMRALHDALPPAPPTAPRTRAARLRQEAWASIRPDYRMHGTFLDAVAEALPGAVIVGDSTQPVYGGNLAWDAAAPRCWFNSATGYGTLGYGLPAAFGAKLARPDAPVVALIGDGGIQFTLPELATAVELGLPVPILLWNNRGYGEIKTYMADRGIPQIGVDIYTPDFQTIARGFGCRALKVESYPELRQTLREAVAANGPTVIEIDDAAVRGLAMKVAVLGAGVVGVATAYYLARDGHEVTLVERRAKAAEEASFGNGGLISPSDAYAWASPDALKMAVKSLYKPDLGIEYQIRLDPRLWLWSLRFLAQCTSAAARRNTLVKLRLLSYSLACLNEVVAETGIDYDGVSRGILYYFRSREGLQAAAHHMGILRDQGLALETVDRDGMLELEPVLARAPDVAGAIYSPNCQTGDSHKFANNLAAWCAANNGATLLYDTPVRRLVVEDGRVVAAQTDGEDIVADAFVLAAGSESVFLAHPIGILLPIYPVKGFSITAPFTRQEASPRMGLIDEDRLVAMSPFGGRLRATSSAIFGGFDYGHRPKDFRTILETTRQLFGDAVDYGAAIHWTGLRPMTPTSVPILGPSRYRNLFLNVGHGHVGWSMCCGSGRFVADCLAGRPTEIDGTGLLAP